MRREARDLVEQRRTAAGNASCNQSGQLTQWQCLHKHTSVNILFSELQEDADGADVVSICKGSAELIPKQEGSKTTSGETACLYSNTGVFNLLSSRANLHHSCNPAGRSHCRLLNHEHIKHHHRGMCGSPGDVHEVPMMYMKQSNGCRTSCDVGKAAEELENEL